MVGKKVFFVTSVNNEQLYALCVRLNGAIWDDFKVKRRYWVSKERYGELMA